MDSQNLQKEIGLLIESVKSRLFYQVNSSMVMLYWKIGCLIQIEILKEERAEYGDEGAVSRSLRPAATSVFYNQLQC